MHPAPRAVAAVLLSACASGPAADPVTPPEPRTIAVGAGGGPLQGQPGLMTITHADASATTTLDVPPAGALDALQAAYAAVGIPVTLVDPASGRLGNPRLVARRALGPTPLSRYLQCGETRTGSRADSDRVVMSVLSTVAETTAGKSSVRTTLAAHATDMSGTSTDRQTCSSTGALETLINKRAAALLPPP